MFGKLVVTLAVAGIVYYLAFLHPKRMQKTAPAPQPTKKQAPIKLIALACIGLMFASALSWKVIAWQTGRQLLEITLTNTSTNVTASFQVYKKDLHSHSFITISGQEVRLATNERMQITPLKKN